MIGITGFGLASPLGIDYNTFATNLLAGKPCVHRVTQFDVSTHPCQVAAFLPELPPPPSWDADSFLNGTNWEQLMLWCAIHALKDAGYWEQRSSLRMGLILGIGAEGIVNWEMGMRRGHEAIKNPEQEGTGLTNWLRETLQINGPSITVAVACASANVAMGMAKRWIERGWVDVCLAGGVDRSITPSGMAGFGNLGALSKRNETPETASRPFDKDRDGFVMGEGGAIFVMESLEQAQKRGAKLYAEVAGYGATSDAFHVAIPNTDPSFAAQAMKKALQDARLNPEQVDYVNAHATSTPVGDVFETKALQGVFGEYVGQVPVSGTKSMTGHLISAAAAVEAAACLVALEHQVVPPTINLENLDPECASLCHVPNQSQPRSVQVALSNSYGFGGSNTCLILRKVA